MSYPEGSVILHIGPHKTGTTTLQAAFHQNRDSLAEQGVHYAGPRAHSMIAAMAAASGNQLATADADAGLEAWRGIVAEVRENRDRQVVLSSEFYSEASPERIRAILDELDAERVHVVVTLRPLVRIVASQWQQYMQNRAAFTYDDDLDYPGWLDEVLNRPDDGRHGTPSFWRRHRHDVLIQKWASVVGAERMTIVVVDDSDKQMLTRSLEELLSVGPGTLTTHEVGANRSLTYPEIQVLRAFNRQYVERGLSVADYTRFVRFGAARFLQAGKPDANEPRLLTPQWAVDRAASIGAESAENIAATGIEVIGDLSLLGDPSVASGVGDNEPGDTVPFSVVARFAAGLVKVAAELPAADAPSSRRPGPIETQVRREKKQRKSVSKAAGVEREIVDLRASIDRVLMIDDLSRGATARVLAGRIRRRLRPLVRRK